MVALVVCDDDRGRVNVLGQASFLAVAALRETFGQASVGPMKAASEGSERDLTWSSITSSRPGRVEAVTPDGIAVVWAGDGKPAKRWHFPLKGRKPYVEAGDAFPAETRLLAGIPAALGDLRAYLARRYAPLADLESPKPADRYAAAKALPARTDLHSTARPVIEKQVAKLGRNDDPRLALELANAAASLDLGLGVEFLRRSVWGQPDPAMRMEATLIVTELARSGRSWPEARDILAEVAAERVRFRHDEIRQAAAWGLGRDGLRAYDLLLPYLDDPEADVALHAIAAFGSDASEAVIDGLIDIVLTGGPTVAFAAIEALRSVGSALVVRRLAAASTATGPRRAWLMAALGKLPETLVRETIADSPLLVELEPLLLATAPANWLAREDVAAGLSLLAKQSS